MVIIFFLVGVIGYKVVWGVIFVFYFFLMFVINVILGIIVVGGLVLMGGGLLFNNIVILLVVLVMLVLSINIIGGFIIIKCMLDMFRRLGNILFFIDLY